MDMRAVHLNRHIYASLYCFTCSLCRRVGLYTQAVYLEDINNLLDAALCRDCLHKWPQNVQDATGVPKKSN